MICTCCNLPFDGLTYEWECDDGHTHHDVLYICPRCDSIDVAEVFERLIAREDAG